MSRILIAEDEPGIASFIEKGLRAAGHTTLVVEDGTTAAHAARDEDFDLLILDLGLPGTDGREALAQIRGRANASRSSSSRPAAPSTIRSPAWKAEPTTTSPSPSASKSY